MSRFTGPLRIELSETEQRHATLLEPLIWERDFKGSNDVVNVPIGFGSDGVTVPRIFWSILPPWGHPATRAAVLHDWLLTLDGDRADADKQFFLALKAVGVNKFLANICYFGVRICSLYGICSIGGGRHHDTSNDDKKIEV